MKRRRKDRNPLNTNDTTNNSSTNDNPTNNNTATTTTTTTNSELTQRHLQTVAKTKAQADMLKRAVDAEATLTHLSVLLEKFSQQGDSNSSNTEGKDSADLAVRLGQMLEERDKTIAEQREREREREKERKKEREERDKTIAEQTRRTKHLETKQREALSKLEEEARIRQKSKREAADAVKREAALEKQKRALAHAANKAKKANENNVDNNVDNNEDPTYPTQQKGQENVNHRDPQKPKLTHKTSDRKKNSAKEKEKENEKASVKVSVSRLKARLLSESRASKQDQKKIRASSTTSTDAEAVNEETIQSSAQPNDAHARQQSTVSEPIARKIVQRKAEQRWSRDHEPSCVMCGRFAEYESSATGAGICSMECKHAQLQHHERHFGRTVLNRGSGKPASTVVAMVTKKVPLSYRSLFKLQHSGAVSTITTNTTNAPDSKPYVFSGGVGELKVWDLSKEDSDAPPIESVALKTNTLRCCKRRENGDVVVVGNSNRLSVMSTPSSASSMSSTALPKKTRLKSEHHKETQLTWPAWSSSEMFSTLPPPAQQSQVYTTAALKPDSPLCFACCNTGVIHAWDLDSDELVRVFTGHSDEITSSGFACNDGMTLVTASLDNTVRIWNLKKCTSVAVQFGSAVTAVCASPNAMIAIVGLDNGSIWTLNLVTMEKSSLGQHHQRVNDIVFSSDGDWFVTVGKDSLKDPKMQSSLCIVWDALYCSHSFQIRERGTRGVIMCCSVSQDNQMLVTGSDLGNVDVYQLTF